MATDHPRPGLGTPVTVLVDDSAFRGQTGKVVGYDVPAVRLSNDRTRVIGEGTFDLAVEFPGGSSAYDVNEIAPARPYQTTSFIKDLQLKVEKLGHLVVGVEAGAFPGQPRFAYTIGLTPHCGFELVMSGLDFEVMQDILNILAERAKDGQLPTADKAPVMGALGGGYVLRMRPADPSWRFHWIKPVLELQEQPPVWQAEYPDKDGAFPGEPGCADLPQQDFTIPVGA